MRLAIPIAVQNLLISSFSLIDTAMVSQLGGTELSAVGMAGQWAWLLTMFLFGIASGASVFLAQYWGVRNVAGIRRVTGIALLVSFVFFLPIFLTPLISPEFVISLFNRDPDIIRVGSAYLSIALWSYPAVMLNSVISATLRSTEVVKLPMVISGISTVTNGALNYAFIFGIGPIPAMGVEGAAIATVISAWIGPILLLVCAVFSKTVLRASPLSFFRLQASEFRDVLRRMLPVIFNESLWGIGTWVILLIYSNIDKDAYGGVTIFRTCETLAFALVQGLGAACCVSVGKSVGAGEIRNAIRDARRFGILVPLFSIVIGSLLIALHQPILSFFNLSGTLSDVTLQTAKGIIIIYSIELAIRNIPYIQIVGIFRSGGDTLFATLFDVGCLWFFSVPVALLGAKLGLPFLLIVLLVYICEDWPKAFFCLLRFAGGKWIKPVTPEGIEGHKRYLAEKKQKAKFFKNAN